MKKPLHLPGFAITLLVLTAFAFRSGALTLTNPIVFVTQPPIPRELNSSVSNTFLSVVTIFGNQQADTAHAARGGDLWLMTTNLGLVNLTRNAGFGTNGIQHGIGIDVRDPSVDWGGNKVLFSMVVGSPVSASDKTAFFWQLYELTNLNAVIASTNTKPAIVKVSNQPTNCNNVTPTYATDGRIIFMSDRAYNNISWLYPQLDEYKGQPTITGTYSLDSSTGDLKMIQHTPSGAFNPFVDSFGRLIVTRWDHLSQDPIAADDRLGILNPGSPSFNGSFNYLVETSNSPVQFTNLIETFPEPRKFDTNYTAALQVSGNDFNFFLPWALNQTGGNEELINHVGRHELFVPTTNSPLFKSFLTDSNIFSISNLAQRTASGVLSANTNNLSSFIQIVEDPRSNGLYWGVQAPDIGILGGTHTSGQILTLSAAPTTNPTNMTVAWITSPVTASPGGGGPGQPNNIGLFRNPLPMSDGKIIAVFTAINTSISSGSDTNTGTTALPVSQYHFRLMTLTNNNPYWTTNQVLTSGISNACVYWDGSILVSNLATQWELQPVEVRSRSIPVPVQSGVSPIEAAVFVEEGVDLPTFQSDISQRGMALVISRNVTARDVADKQQPYNLRVPNGVSTIANSGQVYDITHLTFLQADFLRGYTNGPTGPQPGRRALATPMHANTNFNYLSTQSNAPLGGTEILIDGSQATFVPANRAVTWHLTGKTNESVVKERYWLSFKPGEVRTCANCHGINAVDQIGRPSPTNEPLALHQLLKLWKTNSANAYSLTVSNGTGGGNYGAGTMLTLTANPPISGKYFAGWSGNGISITLSTNALFTMPAGTATATALYSNLPPPILQKIVWGTNTLQFNIQAQAFALQSWILQTSQDLANWTDIATNTAGSNSLVQYLLNTNWQSGTRFFRLRSP